MAIRTIQTPKSREAGLKKKKQKAQNKKTHSSVKSFVKEERRSVKYTTPGQLNRILNEE